MKNRFAFVTLAAAALLFGSGICSAAEDKAASAAASSTKAQPSSKGARRASAQTNAASKPAAPVKLVDINSASRKELMTLPGITDAEATKIIAGRPYASKAHLVSRNVIDDAAYQAISRLVIAKQPYKDGNRNAALYAPKK